MHGTTCDISMCLIALLHSLRGSCGHVTTWIRARAVVYLWCSCPQVCVPNKVTILTTFPLDPSTSGFVYFTKKGRSNGEGKRFKVRPRVVKALFDALAAYSPPYRAEAAWDWAQAHAVFKGTPDAAEIELDYPILEVDEDVAEDTGPAQAQHGGATEEEHETVSGFVNVLPAADVQGSIDRVLERARARIANELSAENGGGSSTPGGAHDSAASMRPIFHCEGQPNAISEFTPYFFTMAFPEIFLDGSGDFKTDRAIELSMDEWLQHLLWHGNQRAARHKVFCFVANSTLNRHRAMKQGAHSRLVL